MGTQMAGVIGEFSLLSRSSSALSDSACSSPQTVLGRSVGLPTPLGEPDRSNEEGEP